MPKPQLCPFHDETYPIHMPCRMCVAGIIGFSSDEVLVKASLEGRLRCDDGFLNTLMNIKISNFFSQGSIWVTISKDDDRGRNQNKLGIDKLIEGIMWQGALDHFTSSFRHRYLIDAVDKASKGE